MNVLYTKAAAVTTVPLCLPVRDADPTLKCVQSAKYTGNGAVYCVMQLLVLPLTAYCVAILQRQAPSDSMHCTHCMHTRPALLASISLTEMLSIGIDCMQVAFKPATTVMAPITIKLVGTGPCATLAALLNNPAGTEPKDLVYRYAMFNSHNEQKSICCPVGSGGCLCAWFAAQVLCGSCACTIVHQVGIECINKFTICSSTLDAHWSYLHCTLVWIVVVDLSCDITLPVFTTGLAAWHAKYTCAMHQVSIDALLGTHM